MRHRIALAIGAIAAAGTLAIALAAAGFGAPAPATVSALTDPQPAATPQVDTVYLAPVAPPQTITVHRTLPSSGELEGAEGGADD